MIDHVQNIFSGFGRFCAIVVLSFLWIDNLGNVVSRRGSIYKSCHLMRLWGFWGFGRRMLKNLMVLGFFPFMVGREMVVQEVPSEVRLVTELTLIRSKINC